jgi:hypothetical protein
VVYFFLNIVFLRGGISIMYLMHASSLLAIVSHNEPVGSSFIHV